MNSINTNYLSSNSINTTASKINYDIVRTDDKYLFKNILALNESAIDNVSNRNNYEKNSIDRIEDNEYYNKKDDMEGKTTVGKDINTDKETNKTDDDAKEIKETDKVVDDSIKTDDNNKDGKKELKEKLKNIKELISKLDSDIDVKLETITKLKESILSIENETELSSEDKEEMKSILASLFMLYKNIDDTTNIRLNSDVVEDIKLEGKTKNIESLPKEDIKNIKDKLEKLVENIENKIIVAKIVAKNDNNIESTLVTIDNNSNNLLDNIKEIKTEKTKVQSNGRIDVLNNNDSSNNETSEITIVKMKDGVDDVSQRLNNADGNIKTNNTNKTDTLDSVKNFQDLMSRLIDKAKVAVGEGKSEVVMTLKPERLGDVRLRIQIEGDEVNAKIFVDNAEIKDLFTKNLDTVIKSLSELNINVGGFDVLLRDDMSGNDFSEFKELLDKGNDKNNFKKQSELESNIKTIERYSLPERRLNIVI